MSLLLTAIVTAALIVIEHIALWHAPWCLQPPAAYIVGTATIGAGMILWGVAVNQVDAALAFWIIAGAAGFADVAAYWVRGRLTLLDSNAFQAGQVAGLEEPDCDTPDASAISGD